MNFQIQICTPPIRQSAKGNLKRKKHSTHKLIKFEAILNCEVLDAFRRAKLATLCELPFYQKKKKTIAIDELLQIFFF